MIPRMQSGYPARAPAPVVRWRSEPDPCPTRHADVPLGAPYQGKLPAAASAAGPQKNSGKLPSNACKLLTLAQVQKVLAGATEGKPIHDKADKQEICNWEVDGSSDYLGITLRTFTGDATTAKALF